MSGNGSCSEALYCCCRIGPGGQSKGRVRPQPEIAASMSNAQQERIVGFTAVCLLADLPEK